MRFLIGLIFGAAVTLLVATAFNAPVHELRQKGIDAWTGLTSTVAELEPQEFDLAADLPILPTAEEIFTAPEQINAPPADLSAEWEMEPQPQPQPVSESEEEPIASFEPELSAFEETPVQPQGLEAVVWESFHSEASARGFANRMERNLDHPFTVRKVGPAQYSVTYSYADEAERANLDAQIAVLMGRSGSS